MSRLLRTLGLLLLICLAVRVAAWLVTPVLPALGGLFLFALLGSWLWSGGRSNPWDHYRR
jgi:CHASE2 domain-containing sensor protein